MSFADPVAITALVVSLVALVTTAGQLIQQYFATADGYRRCQRSVMGPWATRTRLRWRWREFRFETLYTTPVIDLWSATSSLASHNEIVLLIGDERSRERSLVSDGKSGALSEFATAQGEAADELVNWLSLLDWAHLATRASLVGSALPFNTLSKPTLHIPTEALRGKSVPGIRFRIRSWDFQPPDTVRPLAKTTISAIAIIARRMGMHWKAFRPEQGEMQAESPSHVITSTSVRGLGLVLQYTNIEYDYELVRLFSPQHLDPKNLTNKLIKAAYLPVTYADRFGFGVIKDPLTRRELPVDSPQDIVMAFRSLDTQGNCANLLQKELDRDPKIRFPVGDLVALHSPFPTELDSQLCQVPAPSDNTDGMLTSTDDIGRSVKILKEYINTHDDLIAGAEPSAAPTADWLRGRLDKLGDFVVQRNDFVERVGLPLLPPHLRQEARALREESFAAFRNLHGSDSSIWTEVMRTHLCRTASLATTRPSGSLAKLLFAHIRVEEFLSDIVAHFDPAHKFDLAPGTIVVSWVLMFLYGAAWGVCHDFVPGERVPARYHSSGMPVWLG